jgi:energy-converting hydrogenase B subunit Q
MSVAAHRARPADAAPTSTSVQPRPASPATVAIHLVLDDAPNAVADLAARVAAVGGTVRTLSTVGRSDGAMAAAELEIEIEGVDETTAIATIESTPGVRRAQLTEALGLVFGKRIIVVGGGAQVAQVALGAVSEADRHNLRGERISVDTIPLVGEDAIAAAVRAVADLPRARLLVLAGSIMGGEITVAARELRERGIPIIALNMVGSITDAVDLVVSDPVQAGTMAVMAVAETATFDLARQRGRRY